MLDHTLNNTTGKPPACLCLKEKLAVSCLLLLLATFAACSYANKHKKLTQIQKTIHITCLGACVGQKELEFPHGMQVSDLLARVKLTPEADLSKLVLEQRLKNGGYFIVPTKGKMTLYITGAVKEPGIIYLPEGLRFNQLKQYLALADDADIGIFHRRRRLLCEGETVHIPAKTEYFVRK